MIIPPGLQQQTLKIARRNAAVFPVPVWACPATSWLSSAIGSVSAWIGSAEFEFRLFNAFQYLWKKSKAIQI